MRLWSLHPLHLDRPGLLAAWREALLARAVLRGSTAGYRSHPQLARFRAAPDPLAAIEAFLAVILVESLRRGYAFDLTKLDPAWARRAAAFAARGGGAEGGGGQDAGAELSGSPLAGSIPVGAGQLAYEAALLGAKLRERSPGEAARRASLGEPRLHPLFAAVPGGIEDWERPRPEILAARGKRV